MKSQIVPILDAKNVLLQALSVLPEGSNYVVFTNWEIIKKQLGFADLTSKNTWEDRQAFFLQALDHYSIAHGVMHLAEHSELWGWDRSDLIWEAYVEIDQPPGYVLKFRDDFDFAPLLLHYEEHGFTKGDYSGITTYTHKIDISQDWLRNTELAIVNSAVLPDAKILIMSVNYKAMIDAYLNNIPSIADNSSVQDGLSQLGDIAEGFISADACEIFSSKAILERTDLLSQEADQVQTQLDNRPSLQNYDSLFFGYTYEGSIPLGTIVVHFPENSLASAGLAVRQKLAVEGLTQATTPSTYASTYFSLTDAYTLGENIIFKVVPVENRPGLLFQMLSRRDMTFASCP